MQMSNPFNQQTPIPGVKKVIAVSSGKGGVGKSTVSVNLAAALSRQSRVGLLDADIYGPSIPRMLGSLNQKPVITHGNRLQPIERFGMKLMSMGFIVDEGSAVVWRGPMLFKAIDQFLRDVEWGELDYLVVDLPPGTGDVQLTLAQKIPIAGAICVTTPQNVALVDVKKAIDMWKRVAVPVLGLVENMAWFVSPSGEKLQLFPKGELETYLTQQGFKKLAALGFNPNLALSSEMGMPLLESFESCEEAQEFLRLAEKVSRALT
jgi:ATP-binding protein involved in chromosome partitioning